MQIFITLHALNEAKCGKTQKKQYNGKSTKYQPGRPKQLFKEKIQKKKGMKNNMISQPEVYADGWL